MKTRRNNLAALRVFHVSGLMAITCLSAPQIAHADDSGQNAKTLEPITVMGYYDPVVTWGLAGVGGGLFPDFRHLQGPVNTAVTNNSNQDKNGCANQGGDPIEISYGAKLETWKLFALPGEMGLQYKIYYRSLQHLGGPPHVTDSFSYQLDLFCNYGAGEDPCEHVTLLRPDGSTVLFSGNPQAGLRNYPEVGGGGMVTLANNSDGTWTLHDQDGTTQTYASNGFLTSIKDASGVGWTIAYVSGDPSAETITRTGGQTVTIKSTLVGSGIFDVTVTDPAGNIYSLTENAFGAPLSITFPGQPQTVVTMHYDDSEQQKLTEVDYNGVPYSYTTYNGNNQADGTRLADGSGATSIVYSVDPSANAMTATITNPLGHTSVNQYANVPGPSGNYYQLRSVSDDAVADCGSTVHTRAYDVYGNLTKAVDNNGVTHTYSYAANGQLQTETEASGTATARTTNYVWDSNQQLNRLLSVTVPDESKTSYTYNAQNRLASVTRTNLTSIGTANQALKTAYAYVLYASGMVKTMTVTAPSPSGTDKLTYQYDAHGNVTSVMDGLGHSTTYTGYNGLGEPGHVTGPNGDITDYAWDARGRMASKTMHPNGAAATWTYAYDGYGLLAKITAPDGEITTWNRNAEMRVTSISHNDKDGTSTEAFGYDANGDVTSDVIKRGTDVGKSQSFVYDGLGRVYQAKGANGQVLTYAYDGNGNVLSVTDALGHTTTYVYDALSRVEGSMDAAGGVTSYDYDPGDHVTRVTDPRGLVTTYSYDGLGQLWKQVSPDTGTSTFVYDDSGRLSSKTRASGITISYTYDALNRVIGETASGITRTFAYDTCTHGIGRLCTATHVSDDTVSYSYTPEGYIASRSFSFVSGVSYALGYTYDNMGQLASVTYPDGNQALYDYTRGAVADVRLQIGSASSYAATSVVYRPMDLAMSGWTSSNGRTNAITYDSDLRPANISGAVSLTLSYDLANHIIGITNLYNPSLTQSLTYDATGRIATIASTVDNESFIYDPDGNRIQHVANGFTENSSYQATSNHLIQAAATVYGYDADGDVTTINGHVLYGYSAMGRLVSGNGGIYTIGAEDQRLRKTVAPDQTYFAPDVSGMLLAEDPSGTWQDYVYLNGKLEALVSSGQVYSVNSDQANRPLILMNASKVIVWEAQGLPFGSTVTTNNFGTFNLGYPGQYHDDETNIWYNGYRGYMPWIGRYSQSDPIGLAGGVNTYTYVGDNPISRIDPYGLWSFSFGAYLGFGGAITFGQDPTTGQFFYGGRLGVGAGIGGSIDPNGKRPGAGKDGDNCGHGTTLGVFNEANFTAGVIGGNITQADVGLDLDNPGHGYLDPPAPSDHVSFNRYGFSLGFSTGIEVIGH